MTATVGFDSEHLAELRAGFAGRVLEPSDDGYDEARRIHNALIDRRPALIARCQTASDIADAVKFARASGLDISVRGGAIRIEELRTHDRYRMTAPLTGSFGDIAPVSIVDLSVAGARIAMLHRVIPGSIHELRFQVDDVTGPIAVKSTVMWCKPSPIIREHYAGLSMDGEQDVLRTAIHRLCKRNESRIDLDSLKRKFDALRLVSGLADRQPTRVAV